MIAAVYLATSRPVLNLFCARIRAAYSGLIASHEEPAASLTAATALMVNLSVVGLALAQATESSGLAGLANNISSAFPAFVNLIIAGCYVAGMALAGAAILKFKAHKDNPTQVPLGQPIALLFIGAALLWLPSIIQSTGETVFGNSDQTTLNGPGAAWSDGN